MEQTSGLEFRFCIRSTIVCRTVLLAANQSFWRARRYTRTAASKVFEAMACLSFLPRRYAQSHAKDARKIWEAREDGAQ
jgi:hypothetical protein